MFNFTYPIANYITHVQNNPKLGILTGFLDTLKMDIIGTL